jgi:hypothetical protein
MVSRINDFLSNENYEFNCGQRQTTTKRTAPRHFQKEAFKRIKIPGNALDFCKKPSLQDLLAIA